MARPFEFELETERVERELERDAADRAIARLLAALASARSRRRERARLCRAAQRSGRAALEQRPDPARGAYSFGERARRAAAHFARAALLRRQWRKWRDVVERDLKNRLAAHERARERSDVALRALQRLKDERLRDHRRAEARIADERLDEEARLGANQELAGGAP